MERNELIAALRYCVVHPYRPCVGCVLFGTGGCINTLHGAAADALEAAEAWEKAWTQKCERLEKRIAELEKQLPKQDSGICMTACGTLYVPNYGD